MFEHGREVLQGWPGAGGTGRKEAGLLYSFVTSRLSARGRIRFYTEATFLYFSKEADFSKEAVLCCVTLMWHVRPLSIAAHTN